MAEISLEPVTPELVASLRKKQTFWPALVQTIRAIKAMVMREAITRFGTSRLGYLLAFVEPSLYFIGFIILRSYIIDKVPFGESAVLFLISGFISVRIFLSVSRQIMFSIASNQALMTFPAVTPLSAMFAKAAIETFTMCTILVVFYAFVIWGSVTTRINDLVEMTWAAMALFGLAIGVGFFNSIIVTLIPSYRMVYTLMSLPLLLSSGVFFVPMTMPDAAREIIVWNPVLHCVEWFRVAIYVDYEAMLDKSFPISFGLIAGGLGIIMSQIFRVKLLD